MIHGKLIPGNMTLVGVEKHSEAHADMTGPDVFKRVTQILGMLLVGIAASPLITCIGSVAAKTQPQMCHAEV